MTARRAALAIAVALVLTAPRLTSAEPAAPARVYLELPAPRTLCRPGDGGPVCRELPPGRFLDAVSWAELDLKFRELENARTRLTAENGALRAAVEGWSPGWRTLAIAVASGVAIGAAGYHYFAE